MPNPENPASPDSAEAAQAAEARATEQAPKQENKPESAGQILRFPEFKALSPALEEYLRSLPLSEDEKAKVDGAKGDANSLFECWTEIRHVELDEANPNELRAKIPDLIQELKTYLEAQQKAATEEAKRTERAEALQRLDAALNKWKESTTPAAATTDIPGSVPGGTPNVPTTPPGGTSNAEPTAPAQAAPETVTPNLFDSLLAKVKAATPVVEPEFKTPAEMDAALAEAIIKKGDRKNADGTDNDKYVGNVDNKKLTDLLGTFIRIDAGKQDSATKLLPSMVERDANGKPRWILKGDKVVGFYMNDMGTRMQAHRQFPGGTESFVLDLANNADAWEIVNNQNKYLEQFRSQFGKPDMDLYIAVNRGTNQLTLRRMPKKR